MGPPQLKSESALSLRFTTDRFDYQSDLPPESNAGNRFYGGDVAAFLVDGLAPRRWSGSFIDEDWGWLVTASDETGRFFDVAIYNLNDHGEGGRPGAAAWGLWLHAYEVRRTLGIRRRAGTSIPIDVEETLRAIFVVAGITLTQWDDA